MLSSPCSKTLSGWFDRRQFLLLTSWLSTVISIDRKRTQLTSFVVDLRDKIRAVIPSLGDLLKDDVEDVRSAAVSGVVELAGYGELIET
jgi:hypothetical protein